MRFEFRLRQDGETVAGSWSANREQALAEIDHYAAIYGQDGPVTVQERINGRWTDL